MTEWQRGGNIQWLVSGKGLLSILNVRNFIRRLHCDGKHKDVSGKGASNRWLQHVLLKLA